MNTETFERLLKQAVPDGKTIREIRIRTEKPVMILLESGENLLFSDGTCGKTESYGKKKMGSLEIREDRSVVLADQELIRGILETCSRHSLYAYEREISQGFLTIRGGHRVGIAGKAVVEDGHVRTVRDLSSLNIRVAHEVKGCAKNVLPYLMDGETFLDTLLISPPGEGKTTLLRDLIRELSCGGTWGAGKNVSVVDERSEIAACFGGIAQCDLGPRTDVMDGCPKSEGMLMMLRSMDRRQDPAPAVHPILHRQDLAFPSCLVHRQHLGCHGAAGVAGTGGSEGVFPVCGSFRSSGTGNDSGNL